ncbi:MAG: M4 family metallopeptidase [Gammaproteobacteria bacterium]|nr:M4 family metallopeptidase [Gammaproteobacteria bacterium]
MRSTVLSCFLLSTSFSAWSATPFVVGQDPLKELQREFTLSSTPSLSNAAPSSNELRLIQQHQSRNHQYHIRLQHYYHHIPVYGGDIVLHSPYPFAETLQRHPQVKLSGHLFKSVSDQLDEHLNLEAQAPLALAHFKKQYANSTITQEKISPTLYIDEKNQSHWAYEVHLFIIQPDHMPASPSAIIDAESYQPYLSWNDLKTVKTKALGIGYGGNTLMGMSQYGQGLPPLSIQRDALRDRCFMENKQVRVMDMKHQYETEQPQTMSFKCSVTPNTTSVFWTGYRQDGYDKMNGAFSPSNDALYAAEITHHLYQDWYQIAPLLDRHGDPMRLHMRVHFGDNYDNAFWDGEQMTFGDGDRDTFYPLVSIGITAHEISHGFTAQHANLAYFGQSGAINEAFSDMAAKAAEFYAKLPTDWRIGFEVMKPQSGQDALRYMDIPHRDGVSVDSVPAYLEEEKSGRVDVHHGSGVFNRLFYLIATTPGWTIHQAFDLMVHANMDYWTSYSDFQEGGCGVVYASEELGYETQHVITALEQVGIDSKLCLL